MAQGDLGITFSTDLKCNPGQATVTLSFGFPV